MKNINLKNKIIHFDHSSEYSSREFFILTKEKGGKISMSHVGNFLDKIMKLNIFANLKSECLNHIFTQQNDLNKVIKYIR